MVTAGASGQSVATGGVAAGANEALTAKVTELVNNALPIPANATPEQARQINADRKSLQRQQLP